MSTDDLLDEATRLANYLDTHPELVVGDDDRRILRALVERVQRLSNGTREMTRQTQRILAERDAARGKIDKAYDWAHHIRTTRQRGDIEYNAASDVLAILDGKTGD